MIRLTLILIAFIGLMILLYIFLQKKFVVQDQKRDLEGCTDDELAKLIVDKEIHITDVLPIERQERVMNKIKALNSEVLG